MSKITIIFEVENPGSEDLDKVAPHERFFLRGSAIRWIDRHVVADAPGGERGLRITVAEGRIHSTCLAGCHPSEEMLAELAKLP